MIKNEKQMEKCQFCNNMFGNTQMLKQHQKKTKYCIKIQETKAKEEFEAKESLQLLPLFLLISKNNENIF